LTDSNENKIRCAILKVDN